MKEFYIYESAYDGSLFYRDHKATYAECRDENCGYDGYITTVRKPGDVWRAVADEINVNGSGGWNPEHIVELITEIPWEDEEE